MVTADSEMLPPETMVPVRSFTTTLDAISGSTSSVSIDATRSTTAGGSSGTPVKRMRPESTADAFAAGTRVLIMAATRRAVVKSGSLRIRSSEPFEFGCGGSMAL